MEFSEVNRQISCLEYGDGREEFVSKIAKGALGSVYGWWNVIMYKEQGNMDFATADMADKVLAANQELDKVKREIYESISVMQQEKRNLVKAYLVAIDGMIVLNEVGAAIANKKHNRLQDGVKDLAVKLEYWFKDFKEIWRTVSRESELYRVQDVIIWYADLLRDMEK